MYRYFKLLSMPWTTRTLVLTADLTAVLHLSACAGPTGRTLAYEGSVAVLSPQYEVLARGPTKYRRDSSNYTNECQLTPPHPTPPPPTPFPYGGYYSFCSFPYRISHLYLYSFCFYPSSCLYVPLFPGPWCSIPLQNPCTNYLARWQHTLLRCSSSRFRPDTSPNHAG